MASFCLAENCRESKEKEKERQICDRVITFIHDFENEFIQNIDDFDKVLLNKGLLDFAVRCYFDDIMKYKFYADTDRVNQHKQAAYTIKWISKIRPIQILSDKLTKELIWVNSHFAVFLGMTFLHPSVRYYLETDNNYLEQLLYTAQYRNISGRHLASSMYLLEQLAEKMEMMEKIHNSKLGN